MQLAAAAHLKGVGAGSLVHPQAYVGLQLLEQTGAQVTAGDVLAFPARKGAVVDGEGHGHGRLGDGNKGQRLYLFRVADRIADGDVLQTAHGYDVAHGSALRRQTLQAVEGVQAGQTQGWLTAPVSRLVLTTIMPVFRVPRLMRPMPMRPTYSL